jgi:hypothetical protein
MRLRTLEPCIYLVWIGACTLLSARGFFNARDLHLFWADAARTAADASTAQPQVETVWWSAPLDDTFIHFDFARSFARLHPFEWAEGGGYSSGATSWLYPLVLAVGVALGCGGQSLGTFADVLACTSVFAFLWAARRIFRGFLWTSYLLPIFVLSSGVLGWSLWSGMELALFFALWAALLRCYVEHGDAVTESELASARSGMAWLGMLVVMTRPEALLCCGLFAVFASGRSSHDSCPRWRTFAIVLLPACALTALRGLLNLALTGSVADAGGIVKLLTLRPLLEPREVALRWLGNIGFELARITTYHTSDSPMWGWQLWALVAFALLQKRQQSLVRLLVLQAFCWLVLVAQNEYVRYQNDRYTMPVVLWLLVAVCLGVGSALETARLTLSNRSLRLDTVRRIRQWSLIAADTNRGSPVDAARGHNWSPELLRAAVSALLAGSFIWHQIPRLRQQHWLFGRACRNIAEQQVRVGQWLGAGSFGRTNRVLVGDAGAIPYFADLPAVDAIGLGGTERLPFAKAVHLGVGATVELIERLAPESRPDRFAIYPSWWDLLPVWFGRPIGAAHIKGNVICGGVTKVIYDAEWRGLEGKSQPLLLKPAMRVLDELDFADVVSESAHDYQISSRRSGYVVMKLLPHPTEPDRELFDAGRLVFSDAKVRFFLHGLRRSQPATLVFRAAPNYRMSFRVRVDGRDAGRVQIEGGTGWQEPTLNLDPQYLRETVRVELIAEGSEHILYHLWVTTP